MWKWLREIQKDQILPFSLNRKFCPGTFVESALPPVGEVAERIYQTKPMQVAGIEVDDGYLLSRPAGKGTCDPARDKDAMVCIGTNIGSSTHIVHEQADVSQSMVFAFAGGAYDGYPAFAL